MSVKTTHIDYTGMVERWKRCRDVGTGQDAVHKAGEAYLPRLKDQSNVDYEAYKKRATFYNATWRTVSGLTGMLYRQEPTFEVPDSIKPMLDDVTMSGVPFKTLCRQVAREAILMGRVGLLVDYPSVDNELLQGITKAQFRTLGLRPTMQVYPAESIINWNTGIVNNATVVTQVVLKESAVNEDKSTEFMRVYEDRYRVLDLFEGAYRQRVFRIKDSKAASNTMVPGSSTAVSGSGDEELIAEFFPLMGGQRMDSIPFTFFGVDDVTPKVDVPPLIDLVDLNLAHYRVTADYEHGCHFTGLPTPVITGYQPLTEGEQFYVGSAHAWVFPQPDTRAFYLEFSGQGMTVLQENLDRKEQQMAIVGARMLAEEKKVAETATTASIHRGGENSILSSIAGVLSLGIRRALDLFCEWAGAPVESEFDINRDFIPANMDAGELLAQIQAWQAGAISTETLFLNLQKGEIISADVDYEEEQGRIQANPPLSMQQQQLMLDSAGEGDKDE